MDLTESTKALFIFPPKNGYKKTPVNILNKKKKRKDFGLSR
jgi:hypothetical protein